MSAGDFLDKFASPELVDHCPSGGLEIGGAREHETLPSWDSEEDKKIVLQVSGNEWENIAV